MPIPFDGTNEREVMEGFLREETVGHLAMACGDELYIVPLSYTYVDGRILFHCALQGRKLDMIRRNPNVCFEVSRQERPPGPHSEDPCDAPFESVICWGIARVIDHAHERQAVLNAFQARHDEPDGPREPISLERAATCGAVEIRVTRMTGRRFPGKDRLVWEFGPE
jgi:nitroimidazol reductase NimA-like FMN-containing flavoprotein (pyridoxamine 5'-phosphate oxidase superfamily)